jgi:hypothetical protein
MISSRVSPARLANPVFLRLAPSASTGLSSGVAGRGSTTSQDRCRPSQAHISLLGWRAARPPPASPSAHRGTRAALSGHRCRCRCRRRLAGGGRRVGRRRDLVEPGPVWQLVQADAADPAVSRLLDRPWPKRLTNRPGQGGPAMASCRRWSAAAIHPQHVQAVHQQGRGDADDDGRRQRYADGIEQQGGARAGKVKIPRMSRAGRTVASSGARR